MSEKIKEKVLESVRIAKECPENLQEKCFELILSHYLNQLSGGPERTPTMPPEESKQSVEAGPSPTDTKGQSQEDIKDRDLHMKVKSFLKRSGLTAGDINQIFYKEGDEIKPLYDDLKTTITAESQIRIALLQALRNAISTGAFQFDGEEVRKETQERKCYDPPNFTKIFKNNKALFENFDGYDKSKTKITLSTQGKDKLAEVIKNLQ